MRKLFIILSCILFILSNVNTGYAGYDIPICITINGNYIFTDSEPFIQNDSVYVPIKFVADSLGVESVEWNHEEKSVLIVNGEKTVKIFIDQLVAYVNEVETTMDVAPIISNSRTMVPIRFIAEQFDATVEWDKETYTVDITKENLVVQATHIIDKGFNKEDILWLSKIITVEGRGISLDAKVAIANVVLNRKKSSQFPNTVHDVIFDTNYCVQFPPAHKSSFTTLVPTTESLLAAKLALNGYNNISSCLFFNNRPFNSKANDFYKKIDGEYFYF